MSVVVRVAGSDDRSGAGAVGHGYALMVGGICPRGLSNQGVGRIADFRTGHPSQDRKSTRLNSSHLVISYAVFCLKKKKIMTCSGITPDSTNRMKGKKPTKFA